MQRSSSAINAMRSTLNPKPETVDATGWMDRRVEIRVQRVVPQGDRILVDAEQFFTPFFWPSFLHPLAWYNHVLISTQDNPAGCAASSHI